MRPFFTSWQLWEKMTFVSQALLDIRVVSADTLRYRSSQWPSYDTDPTSIVKISINRCRSV